MLPYDHSRVDLKGYCYDLSEVDLSNSSNQLYAEYKDHQLSNVNYINGNYIGSGSTLNRGRRYIAIQGPLSRLDVDHQARKSKTKYETICDFWKTIITNQVRFVVMVANLIEKKGGTMKPKVGKYWPDKVGGKMILHEDIIFTKSDNKNNKKIIEIKRMPILEIELIDEIEYKDEELMKSLPELGSDDGDTFIDYIVRKIRIKKLIGSATGDHMIEKGYRNLNNKMKSLCDTWEVTQYHYKQWPDHGSPSEKALKKLMAMMKLIHENYENFGRNKNPSEETNPKFLEFTAEELVQQGSTGENGPLLVHCSAGVGRTGTIIAIDRLMDAMRWQGYLIPVSVLRCLLDMRSRRTHMIQPGSERNKVVQYEMVYKAGAAFY